MGATPWRMPDMPRATNNMGIEVDWRDMKQECPQSTTRGTFTGSLVGLIEQLGQEHRVFLAKDVAKDVANLFPANQYFTKRTCDKIQSLHDRTLQLSAIFTSVLSKQKGVQNDWDAIAERLHRSCEPGAPLHLQVKAYHVDIGRDEAQRPGL